MVLLRNNNDGKRLRNKDLLECDRETSERIGHLVTFSLTLSRCTLHSYG